MSVNLKLLRIQNGLTLDRLAQAAGLTRSYLSKVERGLSRPSIGTALQLAKALNVSVEQLFQEAAPGDAVSITRGPPEAAPAHALPVSGRIADGRLSAFVLRPSQNTLRNPSSRHSGEELVYILSGSVELQLSNRREILHAGDCAHFDSAIPHKISSLTEPEARILIVIAQPSAPTGEKKALRQSMPGPPARRSARLRRG